ncbi:DUF6429 family protein [Sporosarcina thermotolerans]|uniref:DUF6429 family protein n=1 Tax=Sporosarcina thermotolerans TaxID=633404 RepID=A0AAW9A6J5_9BACL|nr:DUF6429 family protein [Sporosarcina thermotolerans]MDW0116243.1 DUF6429 family protein [Sporosarcina thermotolerans]WHT48215.1 DUF6429 family protein [Sporosarcina thermotolerans]
MEKQIKELTLLLLYLTSWEEDEYPDGIRRSWKSYPFDALDALSEEDWLRRSKRSKSVYLTDTGIKEAEALMKKYRL